MFFLFKTLPQARSLSTIFLSVYKLTVEEFWFCLVRHFTSLRFVVCGHLFMHSSLTVRAQHFNQLEVWTLIAPSQHFHFIVSHFFGIAVLLRGLGLS